MLLFEQNVTQNIRPKNGHNSIGHQKTHPKISDSLLATVQCPKIILSSVKFPGSWKSMPHFFLMFKSDIIGHVRDCY